MEFYVVRATKKNDPENELMHHGILGMKWGVRRYQNEDGSLTSAGKERYSGSIKGALESAGKAVGKAAQKVGSAIGNAVDSVGDSVQSAWRVVRDKADAREQEKIANEKYKASRNLFYDGHKHTTGFGKDNVVYGENVYGILAPYGRETDYETMLLRGDKAVDVWMYLKKYFTNILQLLQLYDRDQIDLSEIMSEKLLNEDGKIDESFLKDFESALKNKFKKSDGSNKALSDDEISNAMKEVKYAVKIWNEMADDISKQGLSNMFFGSDNKKLNYPLGDGKYVDTDTYTQQIGYESVDYLHTHDKNRKTLKLNGVGVARKIS